MKKVFSGKLKENQGAQYDKDGHSKRKSCCDNQLNLRSVSETMEEPAFL